MLTFVTVVVKLPRQLESGVPHICEDQNALRGLLLQDTQHEIQFDMAFYVIDLLGDGLDRHSIRSNGDPTPDYSNGRP